MEDIERLQQELVNGQRQLAGIQKEMKELLTAYSGFDDIIAALEDMKRANEDLPRELEDKINLLLERVERRK